MKYGINSKLTDEEIDSIKSLQNYTFNKLYNWDPSTFTHLSKVVILFGLC